MLRLLLMRHAKADKGAPGTRDRDRPLNPRGLKDAAWMGSYLTRHALGPRQALVSPARRTRETWSGLALPGEVPVFFDDRLYEARAETILTAIRETEPTIGTVLVIGHNPGLHESTQILIASGDVEARERLHEGLPTAGLAVVDFAVDSWSKLHPHSGRLERFVTARLLRTATD